MRWATTGLQSGGKVRNDLFCVTIPVFTSHSLAQHVHQARREPLLDAFSFLFRGTRTTTPIPTSRLIVSPGCNLSRFTALVITIRCPDAPSCAREVKFDGRRPSSPSETSSSVTS